MRSSLGRLSVFGRWQKARYKRGKREGNLNKQHFLVIRSSLVVPWFFFGSSLVFSPRQIGKEQGKGILIKVLFAQDKKCSANERRALNQSPLRCDYLLEQLLHLVVHILCGEAEFLIKHFVWCGEAEGVESPNGTVLAYKTL